MRNSLDPPEELLKALADHRAVLFAGAGLSRAEVHTETGTTEVSLPTWAELLSDLLTRTKRLNPQETSELKRAIDFQRYGFVAQAIKERLTGGEFDDALDEIFPERLQPTKRHRLITEIPFSAVVTTNYDKLLESAYASRQFSPRKYTFRQAPRIISALRKGDFFVLKAHGDIDDKDSIILSEHDYRQLLYKEPGYRAVLNTIFIMRTVLFIGTSLTDVDLRLVLEWISETFDRRGPVHFALVPGEGVGTSEVKHWREFFGIELILYDPSDGHREVDTFLERLRVVQGGTSLH